MTEESNRTRPREGRSLVLEFIVHSKMMKQETETHDRDPRDTRRRDRDR